MKTHGRAKLDLRRAGGRILIRTNTQSYQTEPVGGRRFQIRRLVLGSLLLFAFGLSNFPFVAVLVFVVFLLLCLRGQLDPVDVLLFALAVEPWLGPNRFNGMHLDWGLAVLGIASLWSARELRYRQFLANKLDAALLLFVLACILSILQVRLMIRTPLRVFLDAILVPFGYYMVAKNCVRRGDLLPKLYLAVSIAILGFGTLGLVEGIMKRDILSYGEVALDPFRINGPMRMAEDYGICTNMLLLFYLGMRTLRPKNAGSGRILRLIPFLGLTNCYLTLMRGLWLSLAAGWIVQAARRNLKRFLCLTPLATLLIFAFFRFVLPTVSPEVWAERVRNERTFNARIATYKSALAMFSEHPLLGVGFSSFTEMIDRYPGRYERFYNGEPSVTTPHNIFMSLLAETGLVGILCLGFFLWQAVRSCLWLGKHGQCVEHREYAIFALSAVTAYATDGLSLHPIRSIDFPNVYLFVFLGLLSGMADTCPAKRP